MISVKGGSKDLCPDDRAQPHRGAATATAAALPLLVLCLAALPAQAAAATHPFLGTTGKNAGLNDACGIAVDGAGNTYISDFNNRRVRVFDESGTLFSIPSAKAENSPCDLAVDSLSHVYGNYLHREVVELLGKTTIDPDRSTGISVNPLNQFLYVAHRTHVSVYEPDGTLISRTIGSGSLGDAYGVAVSGAAGTQGYVYVGDASDNTVKVFDPASKSLDPIEVIDGADTPAGAFTDLTDTDLAIDPASGNLFLADNLQPGFAHPQAMLYEFDAAGTYLGQISHWVEVVPQDEPPLYFNRSLLDGLPTGVAVDGGGDIHVTSGSQEGAVAYDFGAASVTTSRLKVTKAGTGTGTVASQLSGLSIPVAPFPPSSPFSGIECGVICTTEYELPPAENPEPLLTAVARPHSRFTGWSGACTGIGICQPTIGGDLEVTANFAAIPQQVLTVRKAGDGEGLVTSGPAGVDCGSTCAAGFDLGTQATLAAEASAGSEFSGFSGACSGTDPCQVSLDQDRAVTATFRSIPARGARDWSKTRRSLAITVGGSGSGTITSEPAGIDCGMPCAGAYAPGSVVSLIATPDSESHFSGWSGCDSLSAGRCTVTLDVSKTVGAGFEEGPTIELGAFKPKGAAGILAVKVSGPGALKASARYLKTSKGAAKRSGSVSLSVALNNAGRNALAGSGNGRLKVKVAVAFTPSGGGIPIVVAKSIIFKKENNR